MTKKPEAQRDLAFSDNPHAPEVFADEVTGILLTGANMRMTFEAVRCNHVATPGPLTRVVIGRLVMPVESAERMATFILRYLADVKEGKKPPEAPVTLN